MVVGWKLWYSDGTTYSSKQGTFTSAPDDGVVVMLEYEDGLAPSGGRLRRVHEGADWYFSDGDQLFGSNSDSLEENKQRYPNCVFKKGKWSSNLEYRSICDLAMIDYDGS